jgi:exodeoxyribonuclease VII small subunit
MGDEPEPNFEEALIQLERIVETLERGASDLSSALTEYEKGVHLLTVCHRWLDRAEQSVAILAGVDHLGNPTTAPFDATATVVHEPNPNATELSPPGEPVPRMPDRPSARKVSAICEADAADLSDPPF